MKKLCYLGVRVMKKMCWLGGLEFGGGGDEEEDGWSLEVGVMKKKVVWGWGRKFYFFFCLNFLPDALYLI